jgi:flagella basal body P-ring formation protein FlgA
MGRRIIIIILIIGIILFVGAIIAVLLTQGQQPTPEPAPAPENGVGQVITDTESATGIVVGVEGEQAPESSGLALSSIPPDMIEVVVSLQTVPRGWQMTAAELTTDLRFAADVGPNVITDISEAIGLFARTDIYQGQTLTKDSLVNDVR